MNFRYGISPASFARWTAFERITAVRARRGPMVGWAAQRGIVDMELAAIEQATVAFERLEIEHRLAPGKIQLK